MFQYISNGLLITEFPALEKELAEVLKASRMESPFKEQGYDFNLLQTSNGGRSSVIFPKYEMSSFPKMNNNSANKALQKIVDFKNEVFSELIKNYPILNGLEYEKCSSFHTYSVNTDDEHGFSAHIDFGMIAIVFTLGKDFEYSEDNGVTWLKLSDHVSTTKNSVIINFGRVYSTFTGKNPVLHRVTVRDTLEEYGFPDIGKFTLGFFIDVKSDTEIPQEIPYEIQGIHRQNWQFMISNCETFGDYNKKRIDGDIYEVDGILTNK